MHTDLIIMSIMILFFVSKQQVTLNSLATLEVLKFADCEDVFAFCWTKEGRGQIRTTHKLNALSFQSVQKEDFGYYRCEVKETGGVTFIIYKALYTLNPEEDSVPPVSTEHTGTLFILFIIFWDHLNQVGSLSHICWSLLASVYVTRAEMGNRVPL